MAAIVAHSAIKNILQSILSEKEVAENTNAFGIFTLGPKGSKIGYCVNAFFVFFQLFQQLLVLNLHLMEMSRYFRSILLDKGNYRFPKILRNVFGLIFGQPAS